MGRSPCHRARQDHAQPRRFDCQTRARNCPNRNEGHRPIHQPNRQAIGAPCGRQFLLLRRDVHACGWPHLPHAHALELHLVPPRGCVRIDFALERAVHDGHVEGRTLFGIWQHCGVEDERTQPLDGRALGRIGLRSRRACGRVQPCEWGWPGRWRGGGRRHRPGGGAGTRLAGCRLRSSRACGPGARWSARS